MKKRNDEAILQEHFAHWLQGKRVLFTASMMGVYLPVKYAVMRKRMGCIPGHPDIVIYEPRGIYSGLFLELKVSGKPTSEQLAWQADLQNRGYKALIMPQGLDFAEGFNWLRNAVEEYLSL